MDKAMKDELKSAGQIAIALIVIPSILAAIIISLLYIWIPAGVLFTVAILVAAVAILVAAVVTSIRGGAAERRKWER